MSGIASTLLPQATAIRFIPTGSVSATNVQAAIAELDADKSPTTHITHTGEGTTQAVNGYKRFADGTILQWGIQTNCATGTNTTVTMPISYTTAHYTAVATIKGTGGRTMVANLGLSEFTIWQDSGASASVSWLSIGR